MADLCVSYWRPIYCCLRHRGFSAPNAQDLTQDFFVRMLRGEYFKHLDQSKGQFRAYLSVALQNFLRDRWRRWTLRRGRNIIFTSLDAQSTEQGYQSALATHLTPESMYESHWAQTVLRNAIGKLRVELALAGKESLFDHFEAIADGETHRFSYETLAETVNLNTGALHTALHRWRQRYGVLIRAEIARTVVSKSAVEEELKHLLQVVAQADQGSFRIH